MATAFSGLNPGRIFCAACSPRTIKPALMSRTNERLTCATTSAFRKRERRNPAIEDSSFSAGTSCGFEDCSAGMRLKRIPVAIERTSVKVSTRQSMRRSKRSVMSLGKRMLRTALLIEGGEPHASRATAERNEKALGEQLPDESWPARADREPDGDFLPPLGRAREQQVGEIHAREQKHEPADSREDSGESEDGIFDIGDEQARFPEPNAAADVFGIIFPEFAR